MQCRRFQWPLAVVGVTVALGGCTGYLPRYSEPYIVLQPRAAARTPSRPTAGRPAGPASTAASVTALSPEEKDQLFQQFLDAQGRPAPDQTAQTTSAREATP